MIEASGKRRRWRKTMYQRDRRNVKQFLTRNVKKHEDPLDVKYEEVDDGGRGERGMQRQ